MECKFILKKQQNRIYMYYFEDDILIDIKIESLSQSILRNIYVAKVKDVVKNIQSAFVEIQPDQRGYLSLPDCEAPIKCNHHSGKRKDKIVEGDEILVQVIKDAVKTKDPTVSTKLSISGKYIAISYPNNRVGYSNKLSSKEKNIVKKYILSLKDNPCNPVYGYVFRTNIKELIDKNTNTILSDKGELLQKEIRSLTEQFHTMIETGKNRSIYSVLYEAIPGYLTRMKNISQGNTLKVITDDVETYDLIISFFQKEDQACLSNIHLYQDKVLSMDNLYRLNTYLTEATAPKVWLKCGGYLIIEPTEALTVIDVNSGKYDGKKDSSSTAFHVNLEAAEEIARQLRIRNMSGIILIDFINMKESSHNDQILLQLKKYVRHDSVKTNVIDMTPLGLVELTRQKIDPPLWEQLGTIQNKRGDHETY